MSPSITTGSVGGTPRTRAGIPWRSGRAGTSTAELADAVRRHGHLFGCYYSLLDWSHADYPDATRYVDEFMRPQIRELVERFEPAMLWGDGHWGHPGGHWRADAIFEEARTYAAAHGFEIVLQRPLLRVGARLRHVRVRRSPGTARPALGGVPRIGASFCVNRNETVDDFLTAGEIVAMLVETVAKGGNLLLNVGPNADGTIPDVQARLLRESGEWVRTHADAIHGSAPFDVPGERRRTGTRAPTTPCTPSTSRRRPNRTSPRSPAWRV